MQDLHGGVTIDTKQEGNGAAMRPPMRADRDNRTIAALPRVQLMGGLSSRALTLVKATKAGIARRYARIATRGMRQRKS